jgi:hypothetical protein
MKSKLEEIIEEKARALFRSEISTAKERLNYVVSNLTTQELWEFLGENCFEQYKTEQIKRILEGGIGERILYKAIYPKVKDQYIQKVCDMLEQGLHTDVDINITATIKQKKNG